MRESAAGSAAASRICSINRFMGPHIHNLAIVAILAETGGAPATGDALRARGRKAARFVRGGLRFLDSAAGGHQRLPGGRLRTPAPAPHRGGGAAPPPPRGARAALLLVSRGGAPPDPRGGGAAHPPRPGTGGAPPPLWGAGDPGGVPVG